MRLIDADALIDFFNKIQKELGAERISFKAVNRAIDALEPTETFEWCTDCKEYDQEKHCCHRWSKQIRKTVAELEEYYKPKRGEWIDKDGGLATCSVCGDRWGVWSVMNFCPNCGADMREREGE